MTLVRIENTDRIRIATRNRVQIISEKAKRSTLICLHMSIHKVSFQFNIFAKYGEISLGIFMFDKSPKEETEDELENLDLLSIEKKLCLFSTNLL